MAYGTRKDRTNAKREAAAALNVSVRTVNRLKICDKPLVSVKNRIERTKKSQEHRELCEKTAKIVLSGEIDAKQGATHCAISLRQMYRYITEEKARLAPPPSLGTVITLGDRDGTLARPWYQANYDVILVDPCLPRGIHTVDGITKVGATVDQAMESLMKWIINHQDVVFIIALVSDGGSKDAMTEQCSKLAALARSNYIVLGQDLEIISCTDNQLVECKPYGKITSTKESFVNTAKAVFNAYHKDSTKC